jgi:hypothetical protein
VTVLGKYLIKRSANLWPGSGSVIVSKLPSSFILICTSETAYVAVSFPVLARLRSIDLFDPSKTILLGVISRSPCAAVLDGKMIPETSRNANKKNNPGKPDHGNLILIFNLGIGI